MLSSHWAARSRRHLIRVILFTQLNEDPSQLLNRPLQLLHRLPRQHRRLRQLLPIPITLIPEPRDIQTVAALPNILARETSKPAFLPFILALRLAKWIFAKRLLKLRKVLARERRLLTEARHVRA